MDLYDVMAEGCHTPLTFQEIAELFQAGQFVRNQPCKRTGTSNWRTIDELFPLLKHEAATPSFPPHRRPPSRDLIFYAVAGAFVSLTLVALALFLWNQRAPASNERIAESAQHSTTLPVVAHFTPAPTFTPFSQPPTRSRGGSNVTRLEAEKRQREQTAREQAALADQMRATTEKQRQEALKMAGTDYHVPLDEDFVLRDPSGMSVRVKVHDNDVTTFDVWINGAFQREVRKEKGITHSRTDETLLYNNGRASLYYVWEISGILNHCLLRVREN